MSLMSKPFLKKFAGLALALIMVFSIGYTYAATTIYPANFTDPIYDTLTSGSVNSTLWYHGAANLTSFFTNYQTPTFTSTNSTLWYSGASNVTDLMNYPLGAYSYLIDYDPNNASLIIAKNGTTGKIDNSSADAKIVFNYVLTTLASGGDVYVMAGTYTFSSFVTVTNPVHIYGEGAASIINGSFYVSANANPRTFSLLSFIGTGYAIASGWENADNVTVDHCIFSGTMLFFNNLCDFITLSNNQFINSPVILVGTNELVYGNQFLNCASTSPPLYLVCNSSVVANNVFQDCPSSTTAYQPAIGIANPSYGVSITGNSIIWTSEPTVPTPGILISGEANSATYVSGVSITGNIMKGIGVNSTVGIYVHIGTGGSIPALNIKDITISGNVIENFTIGMSISGDQLSVTGNALRYVTQGIWSFNTNSSLINSNSLLGVGAGTDYHGIILAMSYNGTVMNNRIENFNTSISETVAGYTSGDYNSIKYNYLYLYTTGIIKAGASTSVAYNDGYITESSGSLVNSTATTFVFAHGCAGTLTGLWCSFNDTGITGYSWANTNTTAITVTIQGTPAGATPFCYWNAVYKP